MPTRVLCFILLSYLSSPSSRLRLHFSPASRVLARSFIRCTSFYESQSPLRLSKMIYSTLITAVFGASLAIAAPIYPRDVTLDPAAVAEAQPRDDTATRAFTASEIKVCMFSITSCKLSSGNADSVVHVDVRWAVSEHRPAVGRLPRESYPNHDGCLRWEREPAVGYHHGRKARRPARFCQCRQHTGMSYICQRYLLSGC